MCQMVPHKPTAVTSPTVKNVNRRRNRAKSLVTSTPKSSDVGDRIFVPGARADYGSDGKAM
jgi:hypothetical protein